MPVIPATWKEEVGGLWRIVVSCETLSEKQIKKAKGLEVWPNCRGHIQTTANWDSISIAKSPPLLFITPALEAKGYMS
jgi:hypothetical protein